MITALLLASSLAAAPTLAPTLDRPPRVIVEFTSTPAVYAAKSTLSARAQLLARFRADLHAAAPTAVVRHEYRATFSGAAVEATAAEIAAMRKLPYVRAIHPDRAVQALALPAAPAANVVNAALRVNAGGLPTHGEGVRVAVIDTGIDYTHPALGGGFGPGFKVAGGYDFANGDSDPLDDNGHGTHVAGIIAADSDSIIGVAPKVTLYAFKVLDSGGNGSQSDVIAGIEAAADPNGDGDTSDHVDVANLSLGGLGSADDPQSRAVDAAVAAGVIMCVAAGNSGGFAIIGSPGSAHSAITVGAIDDSGTMTTFSSRGPNPGELSFKPDVVAPGKDIVSTWRNGSSQSLSGTSMATPHVTGVCALLVALHRDWSPADVKMALASSATAIVGTPVDRGAGRADAARASQATLFASDSGISFGIDAAANGSFDATRSVTLTNRGSAAQTLNATTSGTSGAALTVTPASATLAPGQSQRFDVHLAVDNQAIGFPSNKVASGAVAFTAGATTVNVPWMVVRSARITISFPVVSVESLGFAPDSTGPLFILAYADNRQEAYVAPGKVWDFLVVGRDIDDGSGNSHARVMLATNRLIDGDNIIALGLADAPYRIDFAALDEHGNRLSSLPNIAGRRQQSAVIQVDWQGKPGGGSFIIFGTTDAVYVSALPQLHLTPFETYMDLDNARFFSVKHDELQDLAASTTLTKTVAGYSHSRWHWAPRGDETSLSVCSWILQHADVEVKQHTWTCMSRPFSAPVTIDSYITPESDGDAWLRALTLQAGPTQVPYIRAVPGATVVSKFISPGPQSPRIANDGDAFVGVSPAAPLFTSSTSGLSSFGGAFGDTRALDGTVWASYDAAGNRTNGGIMPEDPMSAFFCGGCRIEASNGALSVAGHVARGDLVLRFPAAKNHTPPAITSLRLLDSGGRVVDRVKNGEAATLSFSAAQYASETITSLPNADATRVAWRVHGAADWHDAAAVANASDSGTNKTLGRRADGLLFSTDLTPATALPNVLIDLRIDVDDGTGNHMTWTQSPAFMVGNVPVPQRQRAVH